MTRLLLIEPHTSGHHMQYVRHLVRAASQAGIHTQLLTSHESLDHSTYQAMQGELAGQFETVFLPSDTLAARFLQSKNQFANQLGYYRYFQKYFRHLKVSERPDIVFIPYLDYIDKAAALLGSPFGRTSWSGLPMQYKFHYKKMGALRPPARADNLKKATYLRLLKNRTLKSMFTIDELLYEYTKQNYPALAQKLLYVCEPVDIASKTSREKARQKFGLPETGKVLLVYGMLALRKGIQSLLLAMQEPNFPEEICLFLAGPQHKDIEPLLNSPAAQELSQQNRLYTVNQFFMNDDEGDAFRASDIVWLGYKEFYGMSAVMIQAGRMGLPIIACQEGLIGWMTRKHQNGIAVNIASPSEIASAIACFVEKPELAADYGKNGSHLAADYTSEAFSQTICTALAAAAKK